MLPSFMDNSLFLLLFVFVIGSGHFVKKSPNDCAEIGKITTGMPDCYLKNLPNRLKVNFDTCKVYRYLGKTLTYSNSLGCI